MEDAKGRRNVVARFCAGVCRAGNKGGGYSAAAASERKVQALEEEIRVLKSQLADARGGTEEPLKENGSRNSCSAAPMGGGKHEAGLDPRFVGETVSSEDPRGLGDKFEGWEAVKEGILARPDCQKRCNTSFGEKPLSKSLRERWFSRSGRKKEEATKQLRGVYDRISVLSKVFESCERLNWEHASFAPLAEASRNLPLPRLTLEALVSHTADLPTPVTLLIEDTETESAMHKKYGIPLKERMVWANEVSVPYWGDESLEKKNENFHKMLGFNLFARNQIKAAMLAEFEEGDLQPKRVMYYRYGGGTGEFGPATLHIHQVTPALVEMDDGKVYHAHVYEDNAPLKYARELMDNVLRSNAVFKYMDHALTIFTPCGLILQQNPNSVQLFGMTSAENVIFSDFEKNGKPVNRLLALFGGDEDSYNKMRQAIAKGEEWSKRLEIAPSSLKPYRKGRPQCLRKEKVFTGEHDPSACENECQSVWFDVHANQFRDPTDGKEAIFLVMKDISAIVKQEQKLRSLRKHEHELLKSMIPEHIIEHLVEEKKANRRDFGNRDGGEAGQQDSDRKYQRTTSVRSNDSGDWLSLSAVQLESEKRVASLAEQHENVTILFADVVGFTKMSSQCSPGEVMVMLNQLFTLFDECTEHHHIYKVETIGDAYMCVTGLNLKSEREKLQTLQYTPKSCDGRKGCPMYHAGRMLAFAKQILVSCVDIAAPSAAVQSNVQIRVGMHSGDCMSGVVGIKMPRFCLFGDTVNVASRMESNGVSGLIHASKATRNLLPEERWKPTGGIEAKGKGVVETFLLEP